MLQCPQLNRPADMSGLVNVGICSALCNDSSIHYKSATNAYERIGEATEVALRVLAEKVGGIAGDCSCWGLLCDHLKL